MKKAAMVSVLLLGVFIRPAAALDALDVFKFRRGTEVKLQEPASLYDPTQPHGVISPFTGYIGRMVSRLASAKSLKDIPALKLPDLKPGQIEIEYVDPKSIVMIQDDVVRRNYVGVREYFVVTRNIEDVFRMATDFDHLALVFPGLEKSVVTVRRANRIDAESWRKTGIPVFGKRKNYYATTNILWPASDPNRKLIKTQLLNAEKTKAKYQSHIYSDNLWYFESCGGQCTQVLYLGFSLLGWDYQRTPPFFPFVSKEIRKQVVSGVLEGGARSSLASMVRWEDPRFRERPISSFTSKDKKIIASEVNRRLKRLRKEGRIKIDLERIFD